MSFLQLMDNFRRKKIIETLRDTDIEFEDKNDILKPYSEYISDLTSNNEVHTTEERENGRIVTQKSIERSLDNILRGKYHSLKRKGSQSNEKLVKL